MSKHDGGPAYPVNRVGRVSNGMSLRDYFAGQALAGLLGQGQAQPRDVTAHEAYQHADAMLAERNREPSE